MLDESQHAVRAAVCLLLRAQRLEQTMALCYAGVRIRNAARIKVTADFTTSEAGASIADNVTKRLQAHVVEFGCGWHPLSPCPNPTAGGGQEIVSKKGDGRAAPLGEPPDLAL